MSEYCKQSIIQFCFLTHLRSSWRRCSQLINWMTIELNEIWKNVQQRTRTAKQRTKLTLIQWLQSILTQLAWKRDWLQNAHCTKRYRMNTMNTREIGEHNETNITAHTACKARLPREHTSDSVSQHYYHYMYCTLRFPTVSVTARFQQRTTLIAMSFLLTVEFFLSF